MDRSARLARYEAVLSAVAPEPFAIAIFEDSGCPGRVVQVAAALAGEPAAMEATDDYRSGECGLSAQARARLTALEFDADAVPFPNRSVDISLTGPVATVIDAAFIAMGAPLDFDVHLYAAEAGERTWSDQ